MSQKIIDFVKSHVNLQRSVSSDPLSFKPHVLAIWDTSGSIAEECVALQEVFSAELSKYAQSKITYVAADTRVRHKTTKEAGVALTSEEVKTLAESGGGGTDILAAIVEDLSATKHSYAAIVVVTDGGFLAFTCGDLAEKLAENGLADTESPPIALALHPDVTYDPLDHLVKNSTGFPAGTFLADYMVVEAPSVAIGI